MQSQAQRIKSGFSANSFILSVIHTQETSGTGSLVTTFFTRKCLLTPLQSSTPQSPFIYLLFSIFLSKTFRRSRETITILQGTKKTTRPFFSLFRLMSVNTPGTSLTGGNVHFDSLLQRLPSIHTGGHRAEHTDKKPAPSPETGLQQCLSRLLLPVFSHVPQPNIPSAFLLDAVRPRLGNVWVLPHLGITGSYWS